MAKYDWIELEKEYILGDYKSVSAFLKDKGINNNGTTRKYTSGWKDKRRQKEDEKATKVIEKTIDKQSEKEAEQIVNLDILTAKLAKKIEQATEQLDMYMVSEESTVQASKKDDSTNVSNKKTTNEYKSIKGLIDKKGIKQLSSALKDISDILSNKKDNKKEDKIDEYLSKLEGELYD